jgi:AraC-like DNA-binding protein
MLDVLSETLRVIRLVGATLVHAKLTAPWSYQWQRADCIAPTLDPGAERVVVFHVITEGECWLEMQNEVPLHLTAGDVAIFPHADAHRMASEPGLQSAQGTRLVDVLTHPRRQLSDGTGGSSTRVICGYLVCDERLARMLLAGLPQVVRVNLRRSNEGSWIEASIRYALAVTRSPRAGGEGLLVRLAELLFIEVLHLYMDEQGDGRTGWLMGVKDPYVGAALHSLHRKPSHPWTLEELARTAGTSRSVLAQRFQGLMGSSPMQYLTQWRMLLAANLLRSGNLPLTLIAEKVGYQTDTALIRAFRREFGSPPATWRRAALQQSATMLMESRQESSRPNQPMMTNPYTKPRAIGM